MLQLYAFPPSPPCRCVWTVLAALNLDCEFKLINLITKDHKTEDFAKLNPRLKVPCLKDDDFVIAESRAITAYLCNKYETKETSQLYPTDPEKRGVVDQLLYVSENITDMVQAYVNFVGVVFFGEEIRRDKIEEARKALALIEGYLQEKEFTAANHLTIADFHLSSPLFMLELSDFDLSTEFPKTAAWFAKIKALPYFEERNAAGLEQLNNMYKSKGEFNKQ